jgi:glycosyltransferase involved in cell wall biosynthesis
MRIVVDLQGAQSASRHRGIGRHSLALTRALVEEARGHEVILALNGALADSIPDIRSEFSSVLPPEQIRVWHGLRNVASIDPSSAWRRTASESLREAFISSLRPDVVHVTSLFEGATDDAVTSIGEFTDPASTSVVLYDLIPLLNSEKYLHHPLVAEHYHRKLTSLRRAGHWSAISEASKQEAIRHLGFPAEQITNISSAADDRFRPLALSDNDRTDLSARFGLKKSFVMYAGALPQFDPRKNLENLVTAFSRLDAGLRQKFQLLVVAPSSQQEADHFLNRAARAGLTSSDVQVVTHVSDPDLVALYNACSLFCFPSLHEGFGLPALEAMQCGAPTIGSDISSITEVINWKEALFDPADPADISRKLGQALGDDAFRNRLREHGLQQSKSFSWKLSATRMLASFEAMQEAKAKVAPKREHTARPRLAFLSPLPPEQSGISDYSSELLPELSRFYDIDVVVAQDRIDDAWVRGNCRILSPDEFDKTAARYDRIVYQFGNSPFHAHMFDLAQRHPGVVVLHDFYLSSVISWMELHGGRPGYWTDALYQSHGYGAVLDWQNNKDLQAARNAWAANFDVLRQARGVIVHSEFSKALAARYYAEDTSSDWSIVPQGRGAPLTRDRRDARRRLNLSDDDFLVFSFGHMDSTKLNDRLLEAWFMSELAASPHARLVFVGGENPGEFGRAISERIKSRPDLSGRISITGYVSPQAYGDYLQAADLAVQLRTRSRGETSRAVLDCLAQGLPLIINANGTMAEVPPETVEMLADDVTIDSLTAALDRLFSNTSARDAIGAAAAAYAADKLAPRRIAERYCNAIEHQWATSQNAFRQEAIQHAARARRGFPSDPEIRALAASIDEDLPLAIPMKRLFLDVTANQATTLKSGIERVVAAQVRELILNPPVGMRVEPVVLREWNGKLRYEYARSYTARLLGLDARLPPDEPVQPRCGDRFYSPDFAPAEVTRAAGEGLYRQWREAGVHLTFQVFDLLPVLHKEWFPDFAPTSHGDWLNAVADNADGVVCISHAVANDMKIWIRENAPSSRAHVEGSHLGADFVQAAKLDFEARGDVQFERTGPNTKTFLMVGTIEPRKGHLQAISAFEHLWRRGVDVDLVIVGAEGWRGLPDDQRRTIPAIVAALRASPEHGKRLRWIEKLNDDLLESVYRDADCLLAASDGEGFGLPLIEAAQHGTPILARNLPVFREIAGDHATWFEGEKPEDLARAVEIWLAEAAAGRTISSSDLPWRTWAQSVAELKRVIEPKPA